MPVTRSPRGSPTGGKQNQRKEQDASPDELKKQLQELRSAASEKDKEKAKEEADRKKVRANAKKKCAKDIQVVKGDVKKAESKVKKLSQGLSRIQKLEEQNSSKRKQLNEKIDEVLRQAHGKKQVLESELAEARAESSESKMLLSYLEKMQGQISDFGLPLSSEFGISLSSILTSPTGSPTTSPPSSPPPEGAARSNGKVKGTSKDDADVANRTATVNTSMLSDGEDSATSSGTPQPEDATERALRKSLVALDASFHDLEDSAPQRVTDRASKDHELFAQFLELQRLENKQERQIQSLEVAEAASEHEVAILRQRVMDTEAASEHEVAMLLRRIMDREASEEAMVEARMAGLRLESVLASAASGVASQGFGTVPGTEIDRAAITQLCDELRQQEVASVADVSELRSLAWRAEGEAELMTGRVQEQRERELRQELEAADSRARKLHGRLQQQTDEAEEFSRTKANLNAEETHSQHLRQELGESRAEVARFREADRKSRAVHRSTANELQAASTRSQELQERLDEHHSEIAELQAEAKQAHKATELQIALTGCEQELAELLEQRTHSEAKQSQKVSDLQFALNACEEELAELLKQKRHSEEIHASTESGSHAPLPQAPRSPPLPGIGCEGFGGGFDQPSMHADQQRSLTMFGANGNEILDQPCGHAIQQRSPPLPGIGCEGFGGRFDQPSMHADQQKSLTMFGTNGNEILDQPCGHAIQQRSPPLPGIGCEGFGGGFDQPSMHADQQRSLTMFNANGNEILDQPCGHAIQQRSPPLPGIGREGFGGRFDQPSVHAGRQKSYTMFGANGNEILDQPCGHAIQQRSPRLPGIGCEGLGRFDQPSMHAGQERSLTMFGANDNETFDQPCGHAIQQRSPPRPGVGCEGLGGCFDQPSVHAGQERSLTMFGANGNETFDQLCGHAIQQRSPPLPGIGCEGLGRFDQPSMHAGQERSHTMFGANGNEILDQPCGHAIQQRSPPLSGIGSEGFGGRFDQPSMHADQQRSLTMFGANGNEAFDQHCGHAIQQRSPLLPGTGCEGLGGRVDQPSMHADQQRSLTMLGANGNEVLDQLCRHAVQQRSPPLLGIGCGGLGARLDQHSMHAGQQRSLTMFGANGNEKGGGLDQPCGHAIQQRSLTMFGANGNEKGGGLDQPCGHAIQQRNPAVPGHSTLGAGGRFDQLVATGGQHRNPVRVAGGHQVGPNEHADQQRTKFHTMAMDSGLDQPVLVQTGTRNGALDTTSLLSGTSGPAASTSAYPEMRALVHEAEAAAQGLRSTLRQRSEEVAQVKLQLRQRSQRVAQLRAGFTAGSHSASPLPYPLSEASITSPVRAEDSVLQLRAGLAGLSAASFPSASPQAARGSALEALPNFPLTSSSTTWEPNLVPSISSPGLDAAGNTWALHDLQEPIAVQALLEGNPAESGKMASTTTASRSVGLQPDADTPPASPSLRSSGLCTPPRRPMVE